MTLVVPALGLWPEKHNPKLSSLVSRQNMPIDDWLVIADFLPPLWEHLHFLLQFCQDLKIVINMEKSDLELM